MAEQEPTPEQLAELAESVDDSDTPVNYKPPAQKSLQEIQELDQDDESLRKYKETLLGSVVAGEWSTDSDCVHVSPFTIVSTVKDKVARTGTADVHLLKWRSGAC